VPLVAGHQEPAGGDGLKRGLAVPCFAEDPAELVEMGIGAERAGLDGFFLWDHLVHADDGNGPPIVDPWEVLAVVAARTARLRVGTMITPVARRRPWKLAKEVTTLDLLSGGRAILGVGLGAPAHAEFGLFGEPEEARVRAERLDEGLDVLAGLWTGQPFSYEGRHFTVGPVRFSPTPLQRPRVPIWVGGLFPADGPPAQPVRRVPGKHPLSGPLARAARWDGFVPIHPGRPGDRATIADIAAAREAIESLRGTMTGFDIAVWDELDSGGHVAAELPGYRAAGATWWIESPRSGPGWQYAVRERLHGRGGPVTEVQSPRG
jgi:Luciferase-like monooxygenase